jgi:hypothetical protein
LGGEEWDRLGGEEWDMLDENTGVGWMRRIGFVG